MTDLNSNDQAAYLAVGTEVSAKFKGAFCEAKIKVVQKCVKCKVTFKHSGEQCVITDDNIKYSGGSGGATIKIGQLVEARRSVADSYEWAHINKIQDLSTYTVVFNDGDERTLKRSFLRFKGERHYQDSETLNNSPLTHPEHFSNPVKHTLNDTVLMNTSVITTTSSGRVVKPPQQLQTSPTSTIDSVDTACTSGSVHDELNDLLKVGAVVSVVQNRKKPSAWYPAVVLKIRSHSKPVFVRSFKDFKTYMVKSTDMGEYKYAKLTKTEQEELKDTLDLVNNYLKTGQLPKNFALNLDKPSTRTLDSLETTIEYALDEDVNESVNEDGASDNVSVTTATDVEDVGRRSVGGGDEDDEEEDSNDDAAVDDSDDEEDDDEDEDNERTLEIKDRFVAQLYKFMDDRDTPINKLPTIENCDLDLYKLFMCVKKLGGYNKATKNKYWSHVYKKLSLPNLVSANVVHLKSAYKRYLHPYEDLDRKLGTSICDIPNNSIRSSVDSHRSLHLFKHRMSTNDGGNGGNSSLTAVKKSSRISLNNSTTATQSTPSATIKKENRTLKPDVTPTVDSTTDTKAKSNKRRNSIDEQAKQGACKSTAAVVALPTATSNKKRHLSLNETSVANKSPPQPPPPPPPLTSNDTTSLLLDYIANDADVNDTNDDVNNEDDSDALTLTSIVKNINETFKKQRKEQQHKQQSPTASASSKRKTSHETVNTSQNQKSTKTPTSTKRHMSKDDDNGAKRKSIDESAIAVKPPSKIEPPNVDYAVAMNDSVLNDDENEETEEDGAEETKTTINKNDKTKRSTTTTWLQQRKLNLIKNLKLKTTKTQANKMKHDVEGLGEEAEEEEDDEDGGSNRIKTIRQSSSSSTASTVSSSTAVAAVAQQNTKEVSGLRKEQAVATSKSNDESTTSDNNDLIKNRLKRKSLNNAGTMATASTAVASSTSTTTATVTRLSLSNNKLNNEKSTTDTDNETVTTIDDGNMDDNGSANENWRENSKHYSLDSLSLNTIVDVRYGNVRLKKVYEAKIIQINAEEKTVKVHYLGWNNRFDEWVDLNRICKVYSDVAYNSRRKRSSAKGNSNSSKATASSSNRISVKKEPKNNDSEVETTNEDQPLKSNDDEEAMDEDVDNENGGPSGSGSGGSAGGDDDCDNTEDDTVTAETPKTSIRIKLKKIEKEESVSEVGVGVGVGADTPATVSAIIVSIKNEIMDTEYETTTDTNLKAAPSTDSENEAVREAKSEVIVESKTPPSGTSTRKKRQLQDKNSNENATEPKSSDEQSASKSQKYELFRPSVKMPRKEATTSGTVDIDTPKTQPQSPQAATSTASGQYSIATILNEKLNKINETQNDETSIKNEHDFIEDISECESDNNNVYKANASIDKSIDMMDELQRSDNEKTQITDTNTTMEFESPTRNLLQSHRNDPLPLSLSSSLNLQITTTNSNSSFTTAGTTPCGGESSSSEQEENMQPLIINEAKYVFQQIDKQILGEDRIRLLEEQMRECRKAYLKLKTEVSIIDRKRKKHRKKMLIKQQQANQSLTKSEMQI